jgi:hypothetical protein
MERLSTVDLLIKTEYFVNKKSFLVLKGADLNKAQGGQLYWFFPFSEVSLHNLMVQAFLNAIDYRGHHWKGTTIYYNF